MCNCSEYKVEVSFIPANNCVYTYIMLPFLPRTDLKVVINGKQGFFSNIKWNNDKKCFEVDFETVESLQNNIYESDKNYDS